MLECERALFEKGYKREDKKVRRDGRFKMRLIFKQKVFSWLDSYKIFDEEENVVFTVERKFALGRELTIYDAEHVPVGRISQRLWSFLPRFDLYVGDEMVGTITKEMTLFKQAYNIDFNGWEIRADWPALNYDIHDADGNEIATVSTKFFQLVDTYVLDINDPKNALYVLMVVVAIDAVQSDNANSAANN